MAKNSPAGLVMIILILLGIVLTVFWPRSGGANACEQGTPAAECNDFGYNELPVP